MYDCRSFHSCPRAAHAAAEEVLVDPVGQNIGAAEHQGDRRPLDDGYHVPDDVDAQRRRTRPHRTELGVERVLAGGVTLEPGRIRGVE
jgi:hypothetical protein